MLVSDKQVAFQEVYTTPGRVGELFAALNQADVRYCHWKSNIRLEASLNGRTDFDLLVDSEQRALFQHILTEFQVKPLKAAPGKDYPGIENYLGFDPHSGKLFHLHVHFQLVLGEQFVKNYRLPLETQFLDETEMRFGIKTPTPTLELILFSLRALLKYRDRDVIKDLLSIRSPGLSRAVLEETDWLLAQTSIEQVMTKLTEIEDVVPADVVVGFLETAVSSPRDGFRLYQLRQSARQALRPYQRNGRFPTTLKYFREMWRRRKSFLKSEPSQKMTPHSGGQTLAIIGADGAGKSTMSSQINAWLSWKVTSRCIYLGSKQPSRRSQNLYLLFRAARRSQRALSRSLGEDSLSVRSAQTAQQFLRNCHHLSIGLDRYRRYRAGQKLAACEAIVLFDRYPLEAPLDGPKIYLLLDDESGRVTRALARAEQRLYQKIQPPDHFFFLDVSLDVSLARKPDHSRDAIAAKIEYLTAMTERASETGDLQRFDANLPFEQVLNQLKQAVWQLL